MLALFLGFRLVVLFPTNPVLTRAAVLDNEARLHDTELVEIMY
jgi:hypothetical protein